MRRLYIGGLSDSVTQKDLKDRFGKFGDVEDVELRTRRDEQGIPYKTFGYININISDAELKKCLTVLNKSKWKGGTLQIETAKESFLHRLAQERQEALEKSQQQHAGLDRKRKLLDSLSRAGVENFTMKAADWVVSKFGRVLPVLQLRCQKGSRTRTLKYDPSKYSHNIRRLDPSAAEGPTPVTQLTWEIEGGDDDISKKRRGEFPPYEPSRPKKSRAERVDSHSAVGRPSSVSHTEAPQVIKGFKLPTSQTQTQMSRTHVSDSDVDSEEELRRLVAAQQRAHGALRLEVDQDDVEVVEHDYLDTSRQKGRPGEDDVEDYDSGDTDELLASRRSTRQEKTAPVTEKPSQKKKRRRRGNAAEQEDASSSADDEGGHLASRNPSCPQQQGNSARQSLWKRGSSSEKDPDRAKERSSSSDGDEEDGDDEEDSDYEAMFSNVTRLEISLSDLQKLAENSQQASGTTAGGVPDSCREKETSITSATAARPSAKKGTTPEEILAAIMGGDDSEDKQKKKRKRVVSIVLPAFGGTRVLSERAGKEQEGRTLDSEGPQRNQKPPEGREDEDGGKETLLSHSEKCESDSSSSSEEQERKTKGVLPPTKTSTDTSPSSSSCSAEEDEDRMIAAEEDEDRMIAAEEDEDRKISAEEDEDRMIAAEEDEDRMISAEEDEDRKISAEEDEDRMISAEEDEDRMIAAEEDEDRMIAAEEDEDRMISAEEDEDRKISAANGRAPHSEEEEGRQRRANLRRLAAVQQKQNQAEQHRKLIQEALANLDRPAAQTGKRIVFDSDDEELQSTAGAAASRKTLFQDDESEDDHGDASAANRTAGIKERASPPRLFSSSEDEDGGDEDGSRFHIKPQFEGRAGRKLMALQSRFGTDERFRMDSRFLEEDPEEEDEDSERRRSVTEEVDALEEERRKNLSILQSVLSDGQQTCSKTSVKTKTFRDVSALHYDPSRQEHAVFETKADETSKDSKAARRKKREEAQKLPEVSKEIFYDVSVDLKAVFGPTKEPGVTEGKKTTSWDQEDGGREQDEDLLSADPGAAKEDSSGFKFSFFGDGTETGSSEAAEYRVETIQRPVLPWQRDPHFHDSSSTEGEEEEEEQSAAAAGSTEQEVTSVKELFFFYPEDHRLTEGPKLFFRSAQLEEQEERWEQTRSALRQEYRKKHKDARRKLKSSQRS